MPGSYPGMHGSLRDRLLAKTVIDLDAPATVDDAPCWLWTGCKTRGGYGQIRDANRGSGNRTKVYVHRAMYELWFGPIPDGLELDHLCRNRACVNPAHLEPVTPLENLRRGESSAARYGKRTHCEQGHEFTLANTIIRENGGRRCRECKRIYEHEKYLARKSGGS